MLDVGEGWFHWPGQSATANTRVQWDRLWDVSLIQKALALAGSPCCRKVKACARGSMATTLRDPARTPSSRPSARSDGTLMRWPTKYVATHGKAPDIAARA